MVAEPFTLLDEGTREEDDDDDDDDDEGVEEMNQIRISARKFLENPDPKSPSKGKAILMGVMAIVIDTGLPMLCYFILRLLVDPVWAMLISGLPALAICIVRAVWKRELSAMALIIFLGFVLSAAVSLATNNARILLLEKSLMMGVIGFLHLITLIPFPMLSVHVSKGPNYKVAVTKTGGKFKPFLYYMMVQIYPSGDINPLYTYGERVNKYAWLWQHISVFRFHVYVVNAIDGCILFGETVIKWIMILSSMSIDSVVLYSNILFIVFMVAMLAINSVYIAVARKSFYENVEEWIERNYESLRQSYQDERLKHNAE